MSARATGEFVIDTWEPAVWDERAGVTLTHTHVTKTFRGEIEGTSVAELEMCVTSAGPAAYVGVERIEARVQGRVGSFILIHHAVAAEGAQTATWTVAPGSGTGELRGLRGAATIGDGPEGGHSFILDYDLDAAGLEGD